MAYKINSKRAFDEVVEISGRKWYALKIRVSISTDALINKAKPLANELMRTGKEYQEEAGESAEKFSAFTKSLDNLFSFVFGAEQYKKIMKYYGGEYLDMATDLTPFIRDCLVPAAVKAMSDKARK